MANPTRLLLIDDDEESPMLVRHLLRQAEGQHYEVDWRSSYDAGLMAIEQREHDLCLIDYRLNESRTGLDLLRAARDRGCDRPLVLLTGIGDRDVDVEAMRAGAADYLCKDDLNSTLLERTVRYALEHQRLLNERERQALKLRLLAGELGRAEERERRRIAMLIHDELQQTLVASKMRLGNMRRQHPEAPAEDIEKVQELLDEALSTCRNLTTGISPPVLHSAGLLAAFHWLATWMHEHYGLNVEAELDKHAEPEDEHLRTFLFHAVRELLFNVVKHAGAHRVRLSADRPEARTLRIEVIDDGTGFDASRLGGEERLPTQFGLFSIRQRLELMSGSMEIDTHPGGGTRVCLRVPAAASPRLDVRTPGAPVHSPQEPPRRSA